MMMRFSRRDLLKTGAALGGASLAGTGGLDWAKAWAADQPFQPEKGAKLRFLRWGKFLDAEDQATTANIRAFTQATGVEVQIDNVWQDDVQTKAALAANINSGPDIIWALHTTPHLFPDKLVDVTDVADYVGKKYGGWYPIIVDHGKQRDRRMAIPSAVLGVLADYRIPGVEPGGLAK